jgi:membrane fusion protein, multidrug efflux system
MTIKRIHAVVAVVGLMAAGSAAYVYQRQGPAESTRAVGSNEAAPADGNAGAAGSGAQGGPATVEVGKVEVMTLHDDAQAVGSLRSRQGVMLRPEVSGRISKLGFVDGQRVRSGQLLVQLDDTLQQAQLKQSLAQASIARTNLQRNRDLVAQGFVSQSVVDQTAAVLEVAEAQVAVARAQLGRMRIVAPFDGIAGIRLVSVGDFVKDGADLVNVEDVGSMLVDFRLPERLSSRLKIGQPVVVTLDGVPGRSFAGHVEAVDAQVDADGRSLLVRARLDNRDGVLRPGMFARTRIVFAVRDKALVVPEEALVPQGGKQYLVKVIDTANGKVTQRLEAKLGLRVPGKAEILEGLSPNDVVVTAGQSKVMRADGLPIRVVDIGAPPARAPNGAGRPASGPSGGAV